MKALKLILLFVVLVGAIFLAMNWNSWFQSIAGDEDTFAETDLVDVGEKCDEIRDSWASQSGWNLETYQIQREDIDQSKAMGMFSLEGYNTVNNCLRETSINVACNAYVEALHKTSFSEQELQKQWDGVRYLKSKEQLANDVRVKRVEQLDQLYRRIRLFARDPHDITPRFNIQNCTWVSFVNSQNQILALARDLRQNPLFKEMENVPGFKAALDEVKLKKIIESQQARFYKGLSAQICKHFDSVEANHENLELLNQVYRRFMQEQKRYGVTELATAFVSFKDRINKSEHLKKEL